MVTVAGLWFLGGATAIFCPLIAGQSIPSSWREPAITIPRHESIQRAKAAIDRYFSTLPAPGASNLGDWLGLSQFCIEMADFDLLTGQDSYKQVLKSYIQAAERIQPGFADRFVRGGIAFGNAAARAYEAYKDEDFLNYTVEAWNWGRKFTVSEENINAGAISVKNFTLQKTCGIASMTGGTFGLNTTDDTLLDSWATGNFLVLSASLYKITSNEAYLSAANSAAGFLRSYMYKNQGLVVSAISGKEEEQCRSQQDTPAYNTGIMLQGISLLKSINSSTEDDGLINDIVVGESLNSQWHNSGGILTTADVSGIYIPRGLLQTYNATSDPTLRNYISAYLSTQYNAVIDLASGPGNTYAPSWTGPAASSFDIHGQSSAISILLAGIPLANGTVTIPPSAPLPDPTATSFTLSESSKTPVASIVGGVIGSLVFVGGVATFALVLYRHRRFQERQRQEHITSHMTESGYNGGHANVVPPRIRIDTTPRPRPPPSTTDSTVLSDTTMTLTSSEQAEIEFVARQRIYRRPADAYSRQPKGHWEPPPAYASQWAP
ncbi:glycoside hydrolase family 76 protein [Moniliophthora roreri MCA 2997]|uniref:Glycoside hydrolase family 76 protein n=1 Tax=Moniliophthora roreri (strain MCA 2997) TaxID=1381753 RepID=V2XZJ7_MONRO|nr:glycoside hydrolase family 76 protein [Moniliophthora roreri MCA 2997]